MIRKIVLIGFMGAGKTTTGRKLAQALDCEFFDADERIEAAEGRRIADIFADDGEGAFRDMETAFLKEFLQNGPDAFVLSAGGGMPLREENRVLLRRLGTVVYLKADKETIVKRLAEDKSRPLLQGGDLERRIAALMAEREQIYLSTAHKVMETDGRTPEELQENLSHMD